VDFVSGDVMHKQIWGPLWKYEDWV